MPRARRPRRSRQSALWKSSRTQARLRLIALKFPIEFLNLGFQPGNLIIERARAVGNRVRTFLKPWHVLNQRRNNRTSKAMPTSRAAAASGQVSPNPRRHNSPKLWVKSGEFAEGVEAAVVPSRS